MRKFNIGDEVFVNTTTNSVSGPGTVHMVNVNGRGDLYAIWMKNPYHNLWIILVAEQHLEEMPIPASKLKQGELAIIVNHFAHSGRLCVIDTSSNLLLLTDGRTEAGDFFSHFDTLLVKRIKKGSTIEV